MGKANQNKLEIIPITTKEFNLKDKEKYPFESIKNIEVSEFFGKDTFGVIDDQILYDIIEIYGEEGEMEIVKMQDRGQVSYRKSERILGDRYNIISKKVPCVWEDYDPETI